MKLTEAINYISVHGRYHEEAPPSAEYSVRFPTPYGKIIFAPDTLELRDKVHAAAKRLPRIKVPALKKEIEFCQKRIKEREDEEE